ncbi:uncharacterized protein C8A04DRAFT_10001 [Dichotomopilus funicola]|uniref:Zn(2)-C6 fungal-type domain-containing protein n=1 Tax=Dichotomopilus funicola TaxID=1934379 RepID=A0AAN6V8C2_9PEZI|nr:hypothetical protein C8A04DRAFT_10001 [Dichotomopilus funicola]
MASAPGSAPRGPTMFANTFLVANHGQGGPSLRVVGPQEARKKRPHRCDEGDPCRNCVKRKETCVRPRGGVGARGASSPRSISQTSPPMQAASLPREMDVCPLSESVNLLHMELLHHFERYTIPTLPFRPVWPGIMQLAFQSRKHTYLINAMLSTAAAHLDYLNPGHAQYHRAKYALLNKALHDYRETLSGPVTADNCDALLGTANLIQYLMWCDLSFMEGQMPESATKQPTNKCPYSTASSPGSSSLASPPHESYSVSSLPPPSPPQPLDLSGDRLYFLSTGVRQIFFMAWPLFQSPQSAFAHVSLLGPCMRLEDAAEARGLNWQRIMGAFMAIYDNPRYIGDREPDYIINNNAAPYYPTPQPSSPSYTCTSTTPGSFGNTTIAASTTTTINTTDHATSGSFLEGLLSNNPPASPCTTAPGSNSSPQPYHIMTLWDSYKEGEAYVRSVGSGRPPNEAATRAAFKRLATRLAVALAVALDIQKNGDSKGKGLAEVRKSDTVRYVSTFPMMCFGPLLALIGSGDSRMLVLLFHIYRVADLLLPEEQQWWLRKRVVVMQEAIAKELKGRGLEVCLRGLSVVP